MQVQMITLSFRRIAVYLDIHVLYNLRFRDSELQLKFHNKQNVYIGRVSQTNFYIYQQKLCDVSPWDFTISRCNWVFVKQKFHLQNFCLPNKLLNHQIIFAHDCHIFI